MEHTAQFESRMDSMASDIHMLTAPFRILFQLLVISAAILSFPLLCMGLLLVVAYGSQVSEILRHVPYFPPIWATVFVPSAEELWLAHLVIAVFGPFASCLWFAAMVKFYNRKREAGLAPYIRPFFHAGFAFVLSAVAGAVVFLNRGSIGSGNSAEAVYLCEAVLACFSPSLLYLAYRAIFR